MYIFDFQETRQFTTLQILECLIPESKKFIALKISSIVDIN